MQVIINGLLTTYQEVGNGKTVVLLHGWGDTAETYTDLIAALEPNFKLLAINLPGFGGSQPPGGIWGLEDYSTFIADWLKKINEKSIYAIVGHSNGGAIAIKALASGKLKVDRLVLLASAGVRNENTHSKKMKTSIVKVGKTLTWPLPARAKARLKAKVYKATGSEALLYPELEATFKKVVSQDVRADAAKIRVPTLIIYGTEDTATPPIYGKKIAKEIINSKLELIEESGHFVHHDARHKTNELVKDFLAV